MATLLRIAFASVCLTASIFCIDICDYYKQIGKLHEHPECQKAIFKEHGGSHKERPTAGRLPNRPQQKQIETNYLEFCPSSAPLIQCTADLVSCPHSGQVCTQSDGARCCQIMTHGIPASKIYAKQGDCPRPLGISVLQDNTIGCWLDSNCPGIQKCCVEPNPVTNSATRICRDPEGISSTSICHLPLSVGTCLAPVVRWYYDAGVGKCTKFMYSGCGSNANNFQSLSGCESTCGTSGKADTPSCPADASNGLNCLYSHRHACHTDSDCLGREHTQRPSCCMTKCGYKICYQY